MYFNACGTCKGTLILQDDDGKYLECISCGRITELEEPARATGTKQDRKQAHEQAA